MPGWLPGLFESGAVAPVAMAVLLVETLILLWMRRDAAGALVFNALSGIALLLALGGALIEPRRYDLVAAGLLIGLVAHLADVWMRLRRRG